MAAEDLGDARRPRPEELGGAPGAGCPVPRRALSHGVARPPVLDGLALRRRDQGVEALGHSRAAAGRARPPAPGGGARDRAGRPSGEQDQLTPA